MFFIASSLPGIWVDDCMLEKVQEWCKLMVAQSLPSCANSLVSPLNEEIKRFEKNRWNKGDQVKILFVYMNELCTRIYNL